MENQAGRKETIFRRIFKSNNVTLLIILILVIIVFTSIKPNFFSGTNAINIIYACCTVGLIAIGETLLIISGGVDLSSAGFGAACGVFIAFILQTGIPWYVALLLTLVLGAALGGINAILINIFNLQPFIATLAMASVGSGTAYLFCNGSAISVKDSAIIAIGASKVFIVIPVQIIILIVMYIIFGFILNKTVFGRSLYIIGGNRLASQLAGLNPKKATSLLYILSGFIAAIAGILFAGRMHAGSPNSVSGSEFGAITGAVLGGVAFTGGKGTLGGVLLGLIIIQCFNNGLNFVGLSSYWQMVAKGILLIAALLVDYFRTKRAAE